MVSDKKLRFFQKRLEQIESDKKSEIKLRYPEIKTEYANLIANGAGKIRSEKEIREVIGSNAYRCPPMIEVLDIFVMGGERKAAEKAELERKAALSVDLATLKAKVKSATDLVYFGTDEQLKKALDDLEAM